VDTLYQRDQDGQKGVYHINTYERAVELINYYYQNIEIGLQIILKENPEIIKSPTSIQQELTGIIVFGAQRGMAGNFNLPNINKVKGWLADKDINYKRSLIICSVGERIREQLKDIDLFPEYSFDFPDFCYHLDSAIQDLLLMIEEWRFQKNVTFIQLFYNKLVRGTLFEPFSDQLFPLDINWLKKLIEKKWPSHSIPLYTISTAEIFNSIIRQHFYILLYRAFIESMASENASRLMAMQKAEQNIEERLETLDAQFHHQRQNAITDELLDIIAGFEALTK
jgi:F-type H+-transporting ATPase subunit gamma